MERCGSGGDLPDLAEVFKTFSRLRSGAKSFEIQPMLEPCNAGHLPHKGSLPAQGLTAACLPCVHRILSSLHKAPWKLVPLPDSRGQRQPG